MLMASIVYLVLFSLPLCNAFILSSNTVSFPNSNLRTLFGLICYPDEKVFSEGSKSQITNATQTTVSQKDNKYQTNPLATWVNEPFCMPLSKSEYPPYCVYTSRNFYGGRGISIIATPEAANTLASSNWFMSAHISGTLNNETTTAPGYKLTPLPGRGLGLVANTTYKRGDLIMSEIPLLLSSLGLEKSNLTEKEQMRLYRTAASRLPIQSREMVMGLHGHPDPDSVHDRFNANAFNVFDFAGIFPAIARLNHDCRPNAAFYFDKGTFKQRVHAVRRIVPGEEITISCMFRLS